MKKSRDRFVVYCGGFSGKAKKNGNPFHRVDLLEIFVSQDGSKQSRYQSFFTNEKLTDGLVPGDVVETGFEPSPFLGGSPRLSSLVKLEDSPYFG